MASRIPAERRRPLLIGIAVVAVLLIAGLSVLAAYALTRPAPTSARPAPAGTPTATPSPTATPPPADRSAERRQYRAYVATVVQGGTAVVSGMIGLVGCRTSRAECVTRIDSASGQVSSLQDDLAANPAPPCLDAADQRLQDALSFQQKGLAIAHDGVQKEDRLHAVQGLLLTVAGLWRGGQAIVAGRESNC